MNVILFAITLIEENINPKYEREVLHAVYKQLYYIMILEWICVKKNIKTLDWLQIFYISIRDKKSPKLCKREEVTRRKLGRVKWGSRKLFYLVVYVLT